MKGNLRRLDEIDDSDKNLLHLFKAILNVDCNYVDSGTQFSKRLERVFAYELYHQWSMIIEKQNKKNYNDKYLINGETSKNMSHFSLDGKEDNLIPDMILHKSIDEPRGQAIVCEIKRKGNFENNGFKKDIQKLIRFVGEKQNEYTFGFGVFVLVGDQLKAIIEKINSLNWTIKRCRFRSEKIILVAYDGIHLQTVSLHDALNKENRENYLNKSV